MKDRPWDGSDIQADVDAILDGLAALPLHEANGEVMAHEGDLAELWQDEPMGG